MGASVHALTGDTLASLASEDALEVRAAPASTTGGDSDETAVFRLQFAQNNMQNTTKWLNRSSCISSSYEARSF
ncbi:MAG: hypothetical protein ABI421_11330 [Polyangiaceae bacterium]